MKKVLSLITLSLFALGAVASPKVATTQAQKSTKSLTEFPMVNSVKKVAVASVKSSDADMSKIRRAYTDAIDTLFTNPDGAFVVAPWVGADNYFHWYNNMLLPDTEVTWVNSTAGAPESTVYTWTYADENGQSATSNDKNLVTKQKGSVRYMYSTPVLDVNNSGTPFGLSQKNAIWGGSVDIENAEAPLGRALLTRSNAFTETHADYDRIWLASKNNEESGWTSNSAWTTLLGVDTAYTIGFAELIPYPGRPYTISNVAVPTYVIANAGAKVVLKLVKVTDDGVDLDNPISEATYTFAAAKSFGYEALTFTLKNVDPFTGLPTTDPIVVDGDVMLVVDWTDEGISYFTPMFAESDYEVYAKHKQDGSTGYLDLTAYALVQLPDGTVRFPYASNGGFYGSADNGYFVSYSSMMSYDITYPFLYTEDELEREVAVEGETIDMTLNADRSSDEFIVSGDEAGETDYPEWLSIEFVDGEYSGTTSAGEAYTEYDGTVATTITAEALPEGVKGRKAEVYITIPTQVIKLVIKQGEVEDEPDPGITGDVDGNGIVNGSDVTALYNFLLNGAEVAGNADVDGNGTVNGSDVTALYNLLLK